MDIVLFLSLAAACAPQVHADTVRAIVAVESSFNRYAIGVVSGSMRRQPASLPEALATARALKKDGWNFSVGLAQINVGNFGRLGLNLERAFDPCANLGALQAVLMECFNRADAPSGEQVALRRALSCYYSGNFSTGFRHGYVARVETAARNQQSNQFEHPSP
jgi:type IV secretion system protein VirB1